MAKVTFTIDGEEQSFEEVGEALYYGDAWQRYCPRPEKYPNEAQTGERGERFYVR